MNRRNCFNQSGIQGYFWLYAHPPRDDPPQHRGSTLRKRHVTLCCCGICAEQDSNCDPLVRTFVLAHLVPADELQITDQMWLDGAPHLQGRDHRRERLTFTLMS